MDVCVGVHGGAVFFFLPFFLLNCLFSFFYEIRIINRHKTNRQKYTQQ